MWFNLKQLDKAKKDNIIDEESYQKLSVYLKEQKKNTKFLEFFFYGLVLLFSITSIISLFEFSLTPSMMASMGIAVSFLFQYLSLNKMDKEGYISFGLGVSSIILGVFSTYVLISFNSNVEQSYLISIMSFISGLLSLFYFKETKFNKYLIITSFSFYMSFFVLLFDVIFLSLEWSRDVAITLSTLFFIVSTVMVVKDKLTLGEFKSLNVSTVVLFYASMFDFIDTFANYQESILMIGILFFVLGLVYSIRYLTLTGFISILFYVIPEVFEYLDHFYASLVLLVISAALLYNVKKIKQIEGKCRDLLPESKFKEKFK